MWDVVFQGARIVDGTGNPWYRGDVAVQDGIIADMGDLPPDCAKERVDVQDRVLCPGFVDLHTHSDFVIFRDPVMVSKLCQGVTTQAVGQCGQSAAPLDSRYVGLLKSYLGFILAGTDIPWDWTTFQDWFRTVEKLPLAGNVAAFVGHGTIRAATLGFENRPPSREEMDHMKALLREGMDSGCFGMTTGLIYPPGVYSSAEELIELAQVLKETGGLYFSHMRNESAFLLDSVRDTINIGRQAGIPVQISHHKALGRDNWGLVTESLRMVDEARTQGVDVTIDQYPYTSCSTSVRACLPPWAQEGGIGETCARLKDPDTRQRVLREMEDSMDTGKPCSWESMLRNGGGPAGALVTYTPHTPECEGKSLEEIGRAMGRNPLDVALWIIEKNEGCDLACYDAINDDDVRQVLRHEATMVASDSIPAAPGGKSHPRSFGTNPRVLARYVREEKTLSLESAIRKMTSFPAARLGLHGKGVLRPGMDADLLIFDPDSVQDHATYKDPARLASGITSVYVRGEKVLEEGEHTGKTPGRLLRKRIR